MIRNSPDMSVGPIAPEYTAQWAAAMAINRSFVAIGSTSKVLARRVRLIVLPRRPFRWLFVEPSELHLPKHSLSLHFLFEDTKRLVNVVVANQDLHVMIPSLW